MACSNPGHPDFRHHFRNHRLEPSSTGRLLCHPFLDSMRTHNDTSTMKTVKRKPYREIIVPRRPGLIDRAKLRQAIREVISERLQAEQEQRKLAHAA
jgi:hypothetical protein